MISKQAILNFLKELEKEFPYKIPGQPDTHSEYAESWKDCISRVEAFVNGQPENEKTMSQQDKGEYKRCKECENFIPLPDGPRGGKRGRCKRHPIFVRKGYVRACKLFTEITGYSLPGDEP